MAISINIYKHWKGHLIFGLKQNIKKNDPSISSDCNKLLLDHSPLSIFICTKITFLSSFSPSFLSLFTNHPYFQFSYQWPGSVGLDYEHTNTPPNPNNIFVDTGQNGQNKIFSLKIFFLSKSIRVEKGKKVNVFLIKIFFCKSGNAT